MSGWIVLAVIIAVAVVIGIPWVLSVYMPLQTAKKLARERALRSTEPDPALPGPIMINDTVYSPPIPLLVDVPAPPIRARPPRYPVPPVIMEPTYVQQPQASSLLDQAIFAGAVASMADDADDGPDDAPVQQVDQSVAVDPQQPFTGAGGSFGGGGYGTSYTVDPTVAVQQPDPPPAQPDYTPPPQPDYTPAPQQDYSPPPAQDYSSPPPDFTSSTPSDYS